MTYTTMTRIERLEAMHETMLSMNHEEAYMHWINFFPDCPDRYDYEEVAEDDEMYNDCVEAFETIFNVYKKYGLYEPTTRALKFVKENELDIAIV